MTMNEISRHCRQTIISARRPEVLDHHVVAIYVTSLSPARKADTCRAYGTGCGGRLLFLLESAHRAT